MGVFALSSEKKKRNGILGGLNHIVSCFNYKKKNEQFACTLCLGNCEQAFL